MSPSGGSWNKTSETSQAIASGFWFHALWVLIHLPAASLQVHLVPTVPGCLLCAQALPRPSGHLSLSPANSLQSSACLSGRAGSGQRCSWEGLRPLGSHTLALCMVTLFSQARPHPMTRFYSAVLISFCEKLYKVREIEITTCNIFNIYPLLLRIKCHELMWPDLIMNCGGVRPRR